MRESTVCDRELFYIKKIKTVMVNVTQRSYRDDFFQSLSEIIYFDENIVYDVKIASFNALMPRSVVIYKGI